MNERKKKKRKVGKECNLIDNIFVCLFVVVAVVDKFLFLFLVFFLLLLLTF